MKTDNLFDGKAAPGCAAPFPTLYAHPHGCLQKATFTGCNGAGKRHQVRRNRCRKSLLSRRSKSIYTFLLLLLTSLLPLQAQQLLNQVIPPTPVAANIEKFMGYPVSPSTGVIDVSIPLYQMEYYGLSLPFALKYHSGGIRVQDPLGFTGRGWSLTPGLRISRTVMGKPDEKYRVVDNVMGLDTKGLFFAASRHGEIGCYSSVDLNPEYTDTEHDIFTIQLPGMETSFLIRRDARDNFTAELISAHPIEITPLVTIHPTDPVSCNIYGFRIRDDQGHTYHFGTSGGGTAAGYIETGSGFPGGYNLGWMLRQIVFNNGEKIDFTYKRLQQSYPAYDAALVYFDREYCDLYGCGMFEEPFNPITESGFYGTSEPDRSTMYETLYPATITAPLGTATFTYDTMHKLTSFLVKNTGNQQVCSVKMTYDNLNLLTRLTVGGGGAYKFAYYHTDITNLYTAGYDWWGFCNNTGRSYSPNLLSMSIQTQNVYRNLAGPVQSTSVGRGGNRTPSETYMSAHSLKEVTYPTGGRLTIHYEPHRFTVDGRERVGAGLRVKRTDHYDGVSARTITRNYTYEEPHFTGKFYPDQKCLVQTSQVSHLSHVVSHARKQSVTSFPRQPYFQNNVLPVWYGRVTESTAAGKTVYTYTHQSDKYDVQIPESEVPGYNHGTYLVTELRRYAYRSPMLLTQTHYKREAGRDIPVEKTLYTYRYQVSAKTGYHVFPYIVPVSHTSHCAYFDPMPRWCHPTKYIEVARMPILTNSYDLYTGQILTETVEKRTYAGTDSIVQRTKYTYDSSRPYNVKQKDTYLPTGNILSEQYHYCDNELPRYVPLTSSEREAINTMRTHNYRTLPIQTVHLHNGSPTLTTIVGYKQVRGSIMRPATLYQKKGNGNFETRVKYEEYDNYGNLRYVVRDYTEKIFYIWGYKGMYPIAEVKNSTSTDVKAIVPLATLNTITSSATLSATQVNTLRRLITGPGKETTTLMQYNPLIGMKQINFPRDTYETYTYDTFGRLSGWWTLLRRGSLQQKEEYTYNYVNN